MKSCLRWVGHIVRIDEGHLPRQLFYSEMWEGKRSALKPKKRFKDTIKYYLKQSGLPVDQWEKMASDRSNWRKLIHKSIESFGNSRMQYSAYRHLIHKGKQGPALGLQSHHANCDICGKLCLVSKAICVNVQNLSCTQIMSLQAKLIGCANSVVKSVTAWLAWRVTYEHIEFKGGVWGGGRGHETKEVVTLETERTVIIYIYIIKNKKINKYTLL